MNRTDFQRLAEVRLREAEALLAARLWDGAYYLAGYTVECGLKACILTRLGREPGVIFDEKDFSKKCFTHNLGDLVKAADLERDRVIREAADLQFGVNWTTAKDWSEQSRYSVPGPDSQTDAEELLDAINHPTSGVLVWIRTHW